MDKSDDAALNVDRDQARTYGYELVDDDNIVLVKIFVAHTYGKSFLELCYI
jgi:hypothetical protein